jgi:hypothetical protein
MEAISSFETSVTFNGLHKHRCESLKSYTISGVPQIYAGCRVYRRDTAYKDDCSDCALCVSPPTSAEGQEYVDLCNYSPMRLHGIVLKHRDRFTLYLTLKIN